MRAPLVMTTATLALLGAVPAHAQTAWTGTISSDWFTPGNWSAGVPTNAVDANIAVVAPNPTVVGSPGANSAGLFVGDSGTGKLTILNSGTVSDTTGHIGYLAGSNGAVTVDGPGASWTSSGQLYPGQTGIGTLTILNGGMVSNNGGHIGLAAGSNGTVTVDGAGSSWTNSADLYVGQSGIGTLTIRNGGTVSASNMNVAFAAGSTGTLNIGAASGQAAVAPGTLNVRSFAFGAGTGLIVFNHTASNYVFGPNVSGAGSVRVEAGTTILPGDNTYTGATTVNGGALIVNGSIAPSSLTTVNSGAALLGSGTVGSTVINAGGFLVPGPVGTPGTMTVAGNLALQSGAFYIVQVNPGAAATTNVSGTASLAGTVGAIFSPGGYVVRSYTILSAAGGRTGTFDALATAGLPAGFQTSLSYTGNTAVLNLTAGLVTGPPSPPVPPVPGLPPAPAQPSVPLPNFTVNQLNVGTAIDNFFNSGGALPPGFASLFGLTGGTLANTLTQLDGEVATGAERAAIQLTNSFLTLLTDPGGCGDANLPAVPAISPSACGRGGSVLPFTPEQQASLPPDIALAYASIFKAPAKPIFEQHWSTWGSAYGGGNTSNGNATVGSNNVTTDIFGFAAGMDYNFTPTTLAGFALAGAGTNWGLANGLGTGRSDAFQFGGRVISWFGPAYVKAALAFTNNWFATNRSALGDQLTANFGGQSYGGRIEGGYRYFVLPAFGVTPYGALQAQYFRTAAYSETDVTNGGFGLNYAAMNATDVRTELGARFDDRTLLYGKPFILFGRLAWAHDFVNNPALSAGFQALPGTSFTVNGAPIPHDSALTTAGAQLFFSANWSLLAKFEGEFASGSQTYSGTGTLRYTW